MIKSKRLITSLLASALAAALLPLSALALTADTLEEAPAVTLPEKETAEEDSADNVFLNEKDEYIPVRYKMARGTAPEENQYHTSRLSDAELERTLELISALKAGEISYTGPSVANVTEQVTVGVYPLDPKEFDGETFYVILPTQRLDDQQLLSLISAFEELGIPFDPDSLNERNCSRSEADFSATRDLEEEEEYRVKLIRSMIIRGQMAKDDIHPEMECRTIRETDSTFCFYPYRRMTDHELAAFVLASETAWDIDPNLVEQLAREFAHNLVRLPLAMQTADMYSENYYSTGVAYTVLFEMAENPGYEDELPAGQFKRAQVWLYREPDYIISKHSDKAVPEMLTIEYASSWNHLIDSSSLLTQEEMETAARQWLWNNLNFPQETEYSFWHSDTANMYTDIDCGYKGGTLSIRLYFEPVGPQVYMCTLRYLEDIIPNVPPIGTNP